MLQGLSVKDEPAAEGDEATVEEDQVTDAESSSSEEEEARRCLVCDRPMRQAQGVQCPECREWGHLRCM